MNFLNIMLFCHIQSIILLFSFMELLILHKNNFIVLISKIYLKVKIVNIKMIPTLNIPKKKLY